MAEDHHVVPGRPEVIADVDYAAIVGLGPDQPEYVPSWYQESYGAELRYSQVPLTSSTAPSCPLGAASYPCIAVRVG